MAFIFHFLLKCSSGLYTHLAAPSGPPSEAPGARTPLAPLASRIG